MPPDSKLDSLSLNFLDQEIFFGVKDLDGGGFRSHSKVVSIMTKLYLVDLAWNLLDRSQRRKFRGVEDVDQEVCPRSSDKPLAGVHW